MSQVTELEDLWKRDGVTVKRCEKRPARVLDSFNADGELEYPYVIVFQRGRQEILIEYPATYAEAQEIEHGPTGEKTRRSGGNLLAWRAFRSMLYSAKQIIDTDSFDDYAKAWGATAPTEAFQQRYVSDQKAFHKAVALLGYDLLRDYLAQTTY